MRHLGRAAGHVPRGLGSRRTSPLQPPQRPPEEAGANVLLLCALVGARDCDENLPSREAAEPAVLRQVLRPRCRLSEGPERRGHAASPRDGGLPELTARVRRPGDGGQSARPAGVRALLRGRGGHRASRHNPRPRAEGRGIQGSARPTPTPQAVADGTGGRKAQELGR